MELSSNTSNPLKELQEKMEQGPQVELEINHYFSKDVYAREMIVPKGVAFIGKVHKHENLTIISQGSIVVHSTTEGVRTLHAPCTFVSPPGTQRAGFALTDVVWTTIHGTNETDIDKIEEQFIVDNQEDYLRTLEA